MSETLADVTVEAVLRVLSANVEKSKRLLRALVGQLPDPALSPATRPCAAASS